jgi:phosphoserine aminotransferase
MISRFILAIENHMERKYNFSAGPAMVPAEVLECAQSEMLDWNGSGMSAMEMSHRGKEYMSIAQRAEADLRDILSIPDNYRVLFLQGGASSQFSMLPMNLLKQAGDPVDYLNTGAWSKKAIAEARHYADVNVVDTSEDSNYSTIPAFENWNLNADAFYFHYTPNETIGGVEFHWIPEVGEVPLVADMSSTLLSRPLDVARYGVIYAGAQKNIGPAGLTLVIVRDDLINEPIAGTPSMFSYSIHANNGSMYNTPPTYAWYLAGLVFQWIKDKGGLSVMAEINQRKAHKLYAAIDDSSFYASPVDISCRSWMNIPFTLANPKLDADFLSKAAWQGMLSLKGHRSVGGMRASVYNAMPESGVDTLISFMHSYEKENA